MILNWRAVRDRRYESVARTRVEKEGPNASMGVGPPEAYSPFTSFHIRDFTIHSVALTPELHSHPHFYGNAIP